jgi:hypothetical protein
MRLKGVLAIATAVILPGTGFAAFVVAQPIEPAGYCITEVDVGTGPDRWRRLFKAGSKGHVACPFVGRRTTMLGMLAHGECSQIRLKGVKILRSSPVSEAEFSKAAHCLATVGDSRPDNVPGAVQMIQVDHAKYDEGRLGSQIGDVVMRSGLPVTLLVREGQIREPGSRDWICFEIMDGAAPLDLKSELTKLGVDWPKSTQTLSGNWSNCVAASAAVGGHFGGQGE